MTLNGRKAWLLVIALILSLCVNSFFVGAIINRPGDRGAAAGPDQGRPGQGLAAIAGFDRILQGLPEETRAYLRENFDASSVQVPPAFRDLRAARRGVIDALSDDGFTEQRLAEAFADVRDRTTDLQQLLHRIFLAAMVDMAPEMRAEMAAHWRSRQ